jgi:hypothetical protein
MSHDLPDSQGLRLKEAAAFWPCSVSTLKQFIKDGVVPTFRITRGGPKAVKVGELKAARERIQDDQPTEIEQVPFDDAVRRAEAEL